jgi:hypothetical protein
MTKHGLAHRSAARNEKVDWRDRSAARNEKVDWRDRFAARDEKMDWRDRLLFFADASGRMPTMTAAARHCEEA